VKLIDGWWFPEKEAHLPAWMASPHNRLLMNGRASYQGKKQLALLKLCKRFRTAIDVGAHIGLWTFNLAPLFGKVRCFEPVAEHRSCFARNIDADNVIIYPIALGAQRGTVGMLTEPTSSGDSRVHGEGSVRMETLDSFEFSDIDLIKIDCEGYEENVLRGAEQTLRRCKPVVCVEQKRDMARRFDLEPRGAVVYLETLGYTVATELGGDYLMSAG
jgi:FkbM family methyltransferase